MIRVTKRVEFCAAHRYVNRAWDDAENRRRFGKAANLHGHNYVLEVTIQGTPSPDTGMVMDLKALKDLITEAVLDRLDHKNLNVDVVAFADDAAHAGKPGRRDLGPGSRFDWRTSACTVCACGRTADRMWTTSGRRRQP